MKNKMIIMVLMLLSFNVLASNNNCLDLITDDGNLYGWGNEVDVMHHDQVDFYLETPYSADEFIINVDEFAGFECDVQIKKYGDSCLLITTFWSPGSDSSGCELNLSRDGVDLGKSSLYMSY